MTGTTDTVQPEPRESRPGFWRGALVLLLYPARGNSPLFLAAMALCLTVKPLADRLLGSGLSLLLRTPLLALSGVLGLAALVVLPSYFSAVVNRGAAGEQTAPGWPVLSDPAALAGTALKVYAVVTWSLFPLLIYLLSLENGKTAPSLPLAFTLYVLASLYLPMALLMLMRLNKVWQCLLPSNVIDPIVRTFRSYWHLPLLMLAIGLFMPVIAQLARVPLVGPAAAVFCGLYLLSCAMAALGRFYRREQGTLNWRPSP